MKLLLGVALASAAVLTPSHSTGQPDVVSPAMNDASYQEVLPKASSFETEERAYKHLRGYDADGKLVGFVFLTQDLGVRTRGYNGVIPILVGMDVRARITGVKLLKHYEPYGYRSINLPEYRAQFVGKSVLEPLEVGDDIDGYSGATITTVAATKSIRHSSRRMAREFLVKK